jgi:hypothetical protein
MTGANDTSLGNTMNDFKRSITAFPRFDVSRGRINELGSFYMNDQVRSHIPSSSRARVDLFM